MVQSVKDPAWLQLWHSKILYLVYYLQRIYEVGIIYSHFSKDQTKVQKKSLLCPRSHSQEVAELGLRLSVKQKTWAVPT